MYEMRRKDRQIPNEEAIALLKQQQYGVLSTMGRGALFFCRFTFPLGII